MNKVLGLSATIAALFLLSACSTSNADADTKPVKSVKVTSGLKDGKIKDDMATLKGTAKGYKYVSFASNGTIWDVTKVKDGKWNLNADDDSVVKTGYVFATKKKPARLGDFDKDDYKEVTAYKFSKKALASSKAYEDENDDSSSSSSSSDDSNSSTSSSSASAYYSPNYSYDQLARTPDDYKGTKMQFTGSVVQEIESDDDDTIELRVAIGGDYDKIVLVDYDSSIMHGARVLEDDKVTFYGTSLGTTTYESTDSGDVTIPAFEVDKITDSGAAGDEYGY